MGLGYALSALVVAGIAGGGIFFALANRATRREHARFGRPEVEAALQCVLDDNQCHDAFDLFLAWPIDDPYLESLRKRCHEVARTSPPGRPGEDMGESGKDRIRSVLRELRGQG